MEHWFWFAWLSVLLLHFISCGAACAVILGHISKDVLLQVRFFPFVSCSYHASINYHAPVPLNSIDPYLLDFELYLLNLKFQLLGLITTCPVCTDTHKFCLLEIKLGIMTLPCLHTLIVIAWFRHFRKSPTIFL